MGWCDDMKVLITGGAGFIGKFVVNSVINSGHTVAVVDNLSTGEMANVNKQASFYEMDIRDSKMQKIVHREKPDVLIHLAAQISVNKSMEQPILDAEVNISGTINILNCCVKECIKKVIYFSTAAVYGNPLYLGIDENHPVDPISCYGISKLAGEEYIRLYSRHYGLKYTIFRLSNVYGYCRNKTTEGGVVYRFLESIVNQKEAVIYGDGRQTRDFVYVDDVAAACSKAIDSGDNETFNLGTGTATSINELIDIIRLRTGSKTVPRRSNFRTGDILHSYFDNSKITNSLGWKPGYTLEDGINETLTFIYGNRDNASERTQNYC